MSTVAFLTDRSLRGRRWQQACRDVADVGTLVKFRARGVRHPRRMRIVVWVLVAFVIGCAIGPALHPRAGGEDEAFQLLLLLPTMMAGFLVLAVVSAIASGGGRELLSREEGLAYPVSPTTDHLGALLLAPLNIAWVVQGSALVGMTSFALGDQSWPGLITAELFMLSWLVTATTVAQVVAWTAEAIRRMRHGIWTLRGLAVAIVVVFVALQVNGRLTDVLDAIPTVKLLVPGLAVGSGGWWSWLGVMGVLALLFVAALLLGAWPAHVAARRLPRDEARAETHHHAPRRMPTTDLSMLIRIDRASVWRTVPMRRGLTVLAFGPGLVALAGGLPWSSVLILPGLVASGGVLLYGVNAWCLDERGALWRESLPVDERDVFDARAWVLAEWLAAAALVTLVLASIRAGVPTAAELSSALAVLVVVTAQVVAVAMTWSYRRPFNVSMRSARATPAPPSVMVGYSAKLATTTTLTGVCFTLTAASGAWNAAVLLAVPFLCWSLVRFLRAREVWRDPQRRAEVIMTVAS